MEYYEEGILIEERKKKKCDMIKSVKQHVDGLSVQELAKEHGAGYLINRHKIEQLAYIFMAENKMEEGKKYYLKQLLKLWQYEGIKKLEAQDNRKILFVVDRKGNKGKTFLGNWLRCVKKNARYLRNV